MISITFSILFIYNLKTHNHFKNLEQNILVGAYNLSSLTSLFFSRVPTCLKRFPRRASPIFSTRGFPPFQRYICTKAQEREYMSALLRQALYMARGGLWMDTYLIIDYA